MRGSTGRRRAATVVAWLALPALGCVSPEVRECGPECLALREEVAGLKARLAALEGSPLLAKFPPPEWNEDRLKRILEREITTGVYRDEQEREFLENFPAWKRELDRRRAAEPSPSR